MVEKTVDQKNIDYYAHGKMGKTIIDYHKEFENAQIEWLLMIVNNEWDSWQSDKHAISNCKIDDRLSAFVLFPANNIL